MIKKFTLISMLLLTLIISGCKGARMRSETVRVPVRIRVIDSKPVIEVVETPEAYYTIGKIHFKFDKSYIQDKYKPALNNFVDNVKGKKGNIVLIGHADPIGTNDYNYHLSIRRAMSVYDYLRNRLGDTNYEYNIVGKGEEELVYIGNDYKQNVLNRRVDLSFTENLSENAITTE